MKLTPDGDPSAPWIMRAAPNISTRALLYVAIYVALAFLCLKTALLQANAAAVWMPSGFAAGVLIVEGRTNWRIVAFVILSASLFVNLTVNLIAQPLAGLTLSIATAVAIAVGNMLEALVAAWLAERFAGGRKLISSLKGFAAFCLLAPLAALVSVCCGVGALLVSGFTVLPATPETAVTWFIANIVGIILFGSLTCVLLSNRLAALEPGRWPEATLLAGALLFFGQALNGFAFGAFLEDGPKAYMCIPLLMWAAMRFGLFGAIASLLLITLMAVSGTMMGFLTFPAATPGRSMIFLQMFIGMVAVMTIAVAIALAEIAELQTDLERKVRDRTQRIEALLADREQLTSLVVHDLQSPLYGIRNAARAAVQAVAARRIDDDGMNDVLRTIGDTSESLAQRVNDLLKLATAGQGIDRSDSLMPAVKRALAAHRLAIREKDLTVAVRCEADALMRVTPDLEHIVDVVLDNAIRHSPHRGEIRIDLSAVEDGARIVLTDHGPGISDARAAALFTSPLSREPERGLASRGLGLFYARRRIESCGGRLTLERNDWARGAMFAIHVPKFLSEQDVISTDTA